MTLLNNPYGREIVVLHAPADQVYCGDLARHLEFALTERPVGDFRTQCVENDASFRARFENRLERIAALVCLVSHHFVTADFGYSTQVRRLVSAHHQQQLRLIPVFVDNCSLRRTPLVKLRRLPANQRAVNEMELAPFYQEALEALANEILDEIIAIRSHHDMVWRAWLEAAEEHTAAAFLHFLQRFPRSRLAGIAQGKYEELKEQELWSAALHTGTPEMLCHYLRDSPRNEHRRKATLRLLATELREPTARRDAEASENPGVLLDYLTRFSTGDREDIVDRRTRYDLSQSRTDWEAVIAPLQTQADFLGYKICASCEPQEIGTYRLLERSFVTAQRKAERVRDRLVEWRQEMLPLGVAALLILIPVGIIAEYLGISLSAVAGAHPWLLGIGLAFTALYLWSVHTHLRSDADTCEELHGELSRHLIELKVAFLSRDAARLRETSRQLYRAHSQLLQLDGNTRRDYYRVIEWREHSDTDDRDHFAA